MKKIFLSNAEILELDVELNGTQNQDESKNKKGLLSEPLPIRTKYWLDRINTQVASRKTTVEKLRNEIVDKLGEEKDGVKQIPLLIDGKGKDAEKVLNPKIEEFTKQFNAVLEEKEEVDVPVLKIEDLGDLKTEIALKVLFKLLEEPAE